MDKPTTASGEAACAILNCAVRSEFLFTLKVSGAYTTVFIIIILPETINRRRFVMFLKRETKRNIIKQEQ